MNAAARPILEAYARRNELLSDGIRKAIESPTPLMELVLVRELGGALHSGAMRSVIAANTDSGMVPAQVRADLLKLCGQNLSDRLPVEVQEAFPDWDKPLVANGQHCQAWKAEDAAAWLTHFPPVQCLPEPLNDCDAATAALWLNDRASSGVTENENWNANILMIYSSNPWKPALEVLHNLRDVELEELSYRVFVERLRREVMTFHVSERRICVRNAILHVTYGYQTLKQARCDVRSHDLRRVERFELTFGDNNEWIYDLCLRIIVGYAWPVGFTEPELFEEFQDKDDE